MSAVRLTKIFSMRLFRRSWIKARQRPNRSSRNSMRFQQETNTMEVEQLKLLKGRFNPKTLVAGKRGRAVTESDVLFRIDATPTSPICPLLLLPSATEGQANAILHCTVLTGDLETESV